MALLIPKAVRKIRDEGRAEGQAEGLAAGHAEGLAAGHAEEQEAQRRRREEAYRRFGIDVDGVRSLPDTPEVRDFLDGKGENCA